MKAKAAVFMGIGQPFDIREFDVTATPAGYGRSSLIASGVCFDGLASDIWLVAQAACLVLLFCAYGCTKGATMLGIGAWLSGAICIAVQIIDAIPGTLFSTSGHAARSSVSVS